MENLYDCFTCANGGTGIWVDPCDACLQADYAALWVPNNEAAAYLTEHDLSAEPPRPGTEGR